MKELTVRRNDAGQRLDRFVGKAVPLLPETLLQKYIRIKRIKLNGKGAKRDTRLSEGDVLSLYINDEFFEKPREENAYLKVRMRTSFLPTKSRVFCATARERGTITRSLRTFRRILRRRASGIREGKTHLHRPCATASTETQAA